jgi:hypothetical protein
MSKIDPLAKMLGEGVVEMRRRLDAAEGRAEELQRQLNLAHQALRGAREAFAEAEEALSTRRPVVAGMFRHGPDVEEALLIIRETLVALEVAP